MKIKMKIRNKSYLLFDFYPYSKDFEIYFHSEPSYFNFGEGCNIERLRKIIKE